MTDRNWSIAVGLGKILAETHPQACVSSRKFGEKTCELHRLRELPSRGASPLVLYTKNTRRTQKSTFPDLPERVWTSAVHTTQPPAEKISNLFDTFKDACGWEGRVGLFRIVFSQLCCRSESMPISPFFPTMFLGKPYLHVSGSFGYIFTFFGRL